MDTSLKPCPRGYVTTGWRGASIPIVLQCLPCECADVDTWTRLHWWIEMAMCQGLHEGMPSEGIHVSTWR